MVRDVLFNGGVMSLSITSGTSVPILPLTSAPSTSCDFLRDGKMPDRSHWITSAMLVPDVSCHSNGCSFLLASSKYLYSSRPEYFSLSGRFFSWAFVNVPQLESPRRSFAWQSSPRL